MQRRPDLREHKIIRRLHVYDVITIETNNSFFCLFVSYSKHFTLHINNFFLKRKIGIEWNSLIHSFLFRKAPMVATSMQSGMKPFYFKMIMSFS